MDDARYFRTMAAFCLDLADQLSLVDEADKARAVAADYLAKAERLEFGKARGGSASAKPLTNVRRSWDRRDE